MTTVYASRVLHADALTVWQVLRDFNGHVTWNPLVKSGSIRNAEPSDRVGCVREFTLSNGGELSEQLLALDDRKMRLAYSILTSPMPIENYIAEMKCYRITASTETLVSWSATFDVEPVNRDAVVQLIEHETFAVALDGLNEYFQEQAIL